MYDYGYMPQYQRPMYRQEIVKVHGRAGAEAYQMCANSSALLLDDCDPIVWFKQTDGAGYPTLAPYTITPYQPEPPVSTSEILERIKKLEEKVNGKPDTIDA